MSSSQPSHSDAVSLGQLSLVVLRAAVKDLSAEVADDRQAAIAWMTASDVGFMSIDTVCRNLAQMCDELNLHQEPQLGAVPFFNGVSLNDPKAWHQLVDHTLMGNHREARLWVTQESVGALSNARQSAMHKALVLPAPAAESGQDQKRHQSGPNSFRGGMSL